MKLSACIEMLFVKESETVAGRIALARAAGLDLVEFWFWSNKDIDAMEEALETHNVSVSTFLAEPKTNLTDPVNLDEYLAGVEKSLAVAKRLMAPTMITQAGYAKQGDPVSQRASLVASLSAAADVLRGSGVTLILEPLNTRVDHQGYFLDSTVEALDIIDEVARPEVKLLYDLYHSMVMDEHPADVVGDRVDRIAHVHIADHPGRMEPGSGNLDLKTSVDWLCANGFSGSLGMEFRPTGSSVDGIDAAKAHLGFV